MSETLREQKERINNLILSIPKDTEEDKSKIYSWKSINIGSVEIFTVPEKGAWSLQWCGECNSFTCHQASSCQPCRAKISGLGNPDIHKKTIEAQFKNGTFNMLDPEVQKNKTSNLNLKFTMTEEWCSICNNTAKHKIMINGHKNCMKCLGRDFGLGNKITHQKTIEAQLKFGTFNMLNPKTHAKATRARIKNYASGNVACFRCGKKEKLNAFGLCCACQTYYALKNFKDKFCDVCKKVTRHNGSSCCICNPILKPSNFTTKDNVKYYKNVKVTEIISKLDSGELRMEDYPGFNKRFGEWHYKTRNILTGEHVFLAGANFITKDKILYYLDKARHDYVPWEDFKQGFKTKKIDTPEGFVLCSTFRVQDSNTWKGAIGAFEQSLIESNITWFTYIKYYIDENGKLKPLVVGKSGSKIVNTSGSDVSFSMNSKHGPSREFLNNEGLKWCKTQIAICNCNSEDQAIDLELQIKKEFNLFES